MISSGCALDWRPPDLAIDLLNCLLRFSKLSYQKIIELPAFQEIIRTVRYHLHDIVVTSVIRRTKTPGNICLVFVADSCPAQRDLGSKWITKSHKTKRLLWPGGDRTVDDQLWSGAVSWRSAVVMSRQLLRWVLAPVTIGTVWEYEVLTSLQLWERF